jgi:hypothetical protein
MGSLLIDATKKGGDRKVAAKKVPIGCCVDSHKAANRILTELVLFFACQI